MLRIRTRGYVTQNEKKRPNQWNPGAIVLFPRFQNSRTASKNSNRVKLEGSRFLKKKINPGKVAAVILFKSTGLVTSGLLLTFDLNVRYAKRIFYG